MPVTYIKPGEPWPGGHPHARPTIIFGQKPPPGGTPTATSPSTSSSSAESPEQAHRSCPEALAERPTSINPEPNLG